MKLEVTSLMIRSSLLKKVLIQARELINANKVEEIGCVKLSLLVTIDPYANYLEAIIQHPLVYGLRFNTGQPFPRTPEEVIEHLTKITGSKELWVDLKCRELRITEETVIPQDLIPLNHDIEVSVPTTMYFNEGKNYLIIKDVIDGNKLDIKLPKGTLDDFKIRFGKGASINIPDPSLRVQDYLTHNDVRYIDAAIKSDLHEYCLSFVENGSDIEALLDIDPEATIIAKIESRKGLRFVEKEYEKYHDSVRLMAARADLYMEIDRPHEILGAIKLIIDKDSRAIFASRLLNSVLDVEAIPSCSDICDIGFGLELGYRKFLFGDEICEDEGALKSAIGILDHILKEYY